MRKSFEGLHGLVRDRLSCDPLSGHVFLFSNAQRNRLKLLFWDGSGLWVCAKRLEKGRFRWPEAEGEESKVALSHEELTLLLGGIGCLAGALWFASERPALREIAAREPRGRLGRRLDSLSLREPRSGIADQSGVLSSRMHAEQKRS